MTWEGVMEHVTSSLGKSWEEICQMPTEEFVSIVHPVAVEGIFDEDNYDLELEKPPSRNDYESQVSVGLEQAIRRHKMRLDDQIALYEEHKAIAEECHHFKVYPDGPDDILKLHRKPNVDNSYISICCKAEACFPKLESGGAGFMGWMAAGSNVGQP